MRGTFISRPNRFIAHVQIDGKVQICHVKNTGRCKELLIPGCRVILEKASFTSRKTAYDLIAVYKSGKLINIDSQAPNKIFREWVEDGNFLEPITFIKPEYTYKNSRFDFYIESGSRKVFVEVKGVTLEENGIVLFPDAPTDRGIKHLKELMDAAENGYEAYIYFIIQMKNCTYFTPNCATHPEFADTLSIAHRKGVNIRAVCCDISEDSITIYKSVDVILPNTN